MKRRENDRGAGEHPTRAATLELAPAELSELSRALYELGLACLAPPGEAPVFPETSAEQLARLFGGPVPAEGATAAELLEACREVARHSRQNNHPRMFGYVASPVAPAGALANFLAAALNQNVTSWRSSPAATEIERTVVRWLAELIGYARGGPDETCGGLLTGGGSAANLTALFVAHRRRAARGGEGDAPDFSRRGLWGAGAPMTIYASDQAHLSITKAADVLGLGREQVRQVASDTDFRLDVRDLRERVEADRRAGLRPFCVVATAGTVATGAVDPLAEVARASREHDLWFHLDGAYGAPAAAVGGKRRLFDGIELADSVTLDPHKWLYAPVGCGCLLLRDAAEARAAFGGVRGEYIRVFEREEEEAFAFWDYGLELSRPFRVLSVWAVLRYYGARRVAAAVEEDCALAARLGEAVRAAEDFELLAPVTLGICCFRHVPAGARRELETAPDEEAREVVDRRLDDLNARVMHRVQRGGAAYLSNATLRGRFALRASITNFRTTARDLAVTLDAVRRAAREEEENGRVMGGG